MKNTILLQIQVTSPEKAELLISDLADINFYAFEETESQVQAYIYEEDFDEELSRQALLPYNCSYTKHVIQSRNWNKTWEENFEPVIIEDFLVIRASFHKPLKGVQHDIIITPKMSFGTGHHATTYLMAKAMRDIDFKTKSVLDFGTGTGILAILAEKLGAKFVVAIDNDEWSIENAQENVINNTCKRVELRKAGSIPRDGVYDIILCNINLNIIQENADNILSVSQKNTTILLSGFLIGDVVTIENIFAKKGVIQTVKIQKDKWLLMGYKII